MHLTEQGISKANRHRLRLRVIGQCRLAEFAANARLLVASKWHLMVQHIVLVDPDCTRAESVRDTNGGAEVGCMDSSGQAVGGGVAQTDSIGLVFEFGDRAHRSEDLFLHDLHLLADVGEDRWLDEVTLFAVAFTTNLNLRSFFFAGIDIARRVLA